MPNLLKVTAFYRLDRSPQRSLNARVRGTPFDNPEVHECEALFVYRGWCLPDSDGDPDPAASDFGQIRFWLAQEFIKRYPEHSDMFGSTTFSRVCLIRGWPPFERVADLPQLPHPPEESKA